MWKESLVEFHPDDLEKAFREYLDTCPFPPKAPADIRQLAEAHRERRNHAEAAARRERERQDLMRRRNEGEKFYGLNDLIEFVNQRKAEAAQDGKADEPKFCVREMSEQEYDARMDVLKRQAEIAKEKFGA